MGLASRFAAGNITSPCLAFVELFPCSDVPISSFPASATTLHFEFYAEGKGEGESKKSASQSTRWEGSQSGYRRDRKVISQYFSLSVTVIHVEGLDKMEKTPAAIMEELLEQHQVGKLER